MSSWLKRLLGERRHLRPSLECYRFLLTTSCLEGIVDSLKTSIIVGHEGIAYLLGRTDGLVTLAVTAIRPFARTTRGSFEVGPISMAKVVRQAADRSLQVVGQVHTHPGDAFHSAGDVAGARIHYDGYVSLVLPNYGRRLPDLRGAATYFYREGPGFFRLGEDAVLVLPGRVE